MLGDQDFSEFTLGISLSGPTARRTLFALTTAAAALFAAGNVAQAQDCVGGYRMIKEIPIACGAAAEESAFAPAAPLADEPATTGSVSRAQAPSAAPTDDNMSPGGMKCVGGFHWRSGVENSYTTLPMACDMM